MIGQHQLLDVPDPDAAEGLVRQHTAALLRCADALDPALVAAGGGARALEVRQVPTVSADDASGTWVVVHLLVDVRDAMGANAVNTMVEGIAPRVVALVGGRVRLRILSNLADRRRVTAWGRVGFAHLGRGDPARGRAVAEAVEEASRFAERDPYRAATHNKGIMNGIDAVCLATGQDWRAVEAGAHAYAARSGRYTALSQWRVTGQGLHGELTLPLAVGTVGGAARAHPAVEPALRHLLDAGDATSLARVIAAVGLAQNLAALRALATEGIQQGHMRLHARKTAAADAGSSWQLAGDTDCDTLSVSGDPAGRPDVQQPQSSPRGPGDRGRGRGRVGLRPLEHGTAGVGWWSAAGRRQHRRRWLGGRRRLGRRRSLRSRPHASQRRQSMRQRHRAG
jgi:hydroxymethylglutaryl-CoA reductase